MRATYPNSIIPEKSGIQIQAAHCQNSPGSFGDIDNPRCYHLKFASRRVPVRKRQE